MINKINSAWLYFHWLNAVILTPSVLSLAAIPVDEQRTRLHFQYHEANT